MRKALGKSKWEVVDETLLGFFAFGKLRMWKDLAPEAWAKGTGPDKTDIVRAILLAQTMQESSPYSDEEFVDHHAGIHDLLLVKDADSSQVLSVLDVLNGRSVVIQGPPGTGKSQTIMNIIANVLANGKTVLFVAEKMAALDVVKRWLDQVGLGDSCLELHSFKARKTQVIESIRQTMESGCPVKPDHKSESAELGALRSSLNEFAFAMNTPVAEGGISPHKAIGMVERYSRMDPPLAYVSIPAAAHWSSTQLRQNRDHIALVARHLGAVGNPQHHPWRGVMAPALLPSDRQKLAELTEHLLIHLRLLMGTLESVGKPLGFNVGYTLVYCAPMVTLCNLLLERPDSDLGGIANPVWLTNLADILALLADGLRFATLYSALMEQVTEDALGADYSQTKQLIEQKGESVTRFLSGDYWKARKHVIQSCKKDQRPRNYKQAIRLLSDLCEYRELHASISSRNDLGLKAFAKQWNGLQSDWQILQRVAAWVPRVIQLVNTNSILEYCDVISAEDLARLRDGIGNLEQGVNTALDDWNELLKYDRVEAFGKTCENVALQDWVTKLEAAKGRIEAVYEWIEYRKSRDVCKELKISPLVDLFDQGNIEPDRLVPQYEYSSAGEILRAALTTRPVLGQFNGETHEHIIEQFRALDKKLIETTRQYLAAKLWDRLPQPTLGASDASPMNYLINTLRRRRGIPPIRQFMERVGSIVTQIKPCFMMSPMSIAQFLPPNSLEFDVLVIDEASQMKPGDALGALARCKQCVIVGDSKQLPPTQFFDRLGESDGGEEENLGDVESILEAAAHPIGGMHGGRMLRWHYRSKHQSLIAFSNKEFYESKLHVFPSPVRAGTDLGLIGHHIENGLYARSGSRKNLVEAEAVAKAVMEHARRCGDLSLGVVALSKQQQEAVVDKLEELRRENPETEWFFDAARQEPFFVKNLENVQGDERDVIFISIGYGRDYEGGRPHMNFGPINHEGGWRRLNVLITRAKLRCEVFHSIRPDEIRVTDLSDAERYSLRGRVALRNYLEYIQTGQLEQPGTPGEETESPFEDSVAEALRQHGIEVVPQVGVAGFRIDLGVIDPDGPGRYLLGIECDGASYHSARSARDRDRLRQEVLENLGWKIHRIWSLDWLKDEDKEMRRLLLAIEKAKSDSARAHASANRQSKPQKVTVIERTHSQKEAKHPHELASKPYTKYTRTRLLSGHPSDVSSDRLADLVTEIVKVESPIHVNELDRRVAEAFGLQKTGSRIQDAVLLARRKAESLGKVKRKDSFIWDPKMKQPTVRNRLDMNMDVERIAPEEIRVAAEKVNTVAYGLTTDALVVEVARSLGYQRVSANIDLYVRSVLKALW